MTAGTQTPAAGRRDHAVVFYRDDDQLAALVSRHLLPAVRDAAPAILVATPEHIRSVEAHLATAGANLAAARDRGTCLALDAAGAIRGFLVDRWPDPARFWQVITPALRQAASTGQPVRIFGEMVWLLWQAGLVAAAIEVEAMWNQLAVHYDFSLLCAYPQHAVSGDEHLDALDQVCRLHTRVLGPAPGWQAEGAAPAAARPGSPEVAPLPGRQDSDAGRWSWWHRPGAGDQERSSPSGPQTARPLSQPPANAAVLAYRADLPAVRALAAARARQAGLPPHRINDLVLAVGELAANTLTHTSGPGTLTMWITGDEIICQVHDQGHITDPLVGRTRPHPAADRGGRGLWLVHRVCDRVEIHTSTTGTTIRVHMQRNPWPA